MKKLLHFFVLSFFFVQYAYGLVDITVDQTLLNAGFHRYNSHYSVEAQTCLKPVEHLSLAFRLLTTNITVYANLTTCRFLIEDKLPKNVFINVNEVEDNAENVRIPSVLIQFWASEPQ